MNQTRELKVRQLCNTAVKRCFRKNDNESFDGKFEVKFVLPKKYAYPISKEGRYYDFELTREVLEFEKKYKCHLDRFFQDLTDYYCIYIGFEED